MRASIRTAKATGQTGSSETSFPGLARRRPAPPENAFDRLSDAAEGQANDLAAATAGRFRHDFSRMSVHGAPALDSDRSERPSAAPAPVPELHDAGDSGEADLSAGAPDVKAGEPETAGGPEPAAAGGACTMWTRTLASAPDGTDDRRRTVGVNELVRIRCLRPASWSATSGAISPDERGFFAIWTAPATAESATVEATPRRGAPCSVTMTVVAPEKNVQEKVRDYNNYTAGRAGSGFIGFADLLPKNVSFSRIECREERTEGTAAGYYDTALHWDNKVHDQGKWIRARDDNALGQDEVGIKPPGARGPFEWGTFVWNIPQHYRIAGDSDETGILYSTAAHVQVMDGPDGTETTSKEGASRKRTP